MLLILLKRILPFAATFVLGILIASFFITLTMPRLKFERRFEYRNECRWSKRAERERLKRESQDFDSQNVDEMVPPPPVSQAIPFNDFVVRPPVAPTVSRNYR